MNGVHLSRGTLSDSEGRCDGVRGTYADGRVIRRFQIALENTLEHHALVGECALELWRSVRGTFQEDDVANGRSISNSVLLQHVLQITLQSAMASGELTCPPHPWRN